MDNQELDKLEVETINKFQEAAQFKHLYDGLLRPRITKRQGELLHKLISDYRNNEPTENIMRVVSQLSAFDEVSAVMSATVTDGKKAKQQLEAIKNERERRRINANFDSGG